MPIEPIVFGDARDVVAILHLDKKSLEFIAYALPHNDGFTKEFFKVLNEIEKLEEFKRSQPRLGIRAIMKPDNRGRYLPSLEVVIIEPEIDDSL